MSQIYYPQSALEGFGQALGQRLGITVKFEAGQPRTDGKTIYLPEIGQKLLDEFGFTAMCGIAMHEAAHVHYDSNKHHQKYAGGDSLKAACYNAVIDVADETRICRLLRCGSDMLGSSNVHGYLEILKADAMTPGKGDPVWRMLAAAILQCRSNYVRTGSGARPPIPPLPESLESVTKRWPQPEQDLFDKIRWAMRDAIASRRVKGGKRSASDWKEIVRITDEIVDLLKKAGHTSAPSREGKQGPVGSKPGGNPRAGAGLAEGGTDPGNVPGGSQVAKFDGAAALDSKSPSRAGTATSTPPPPRPYSAPTSSTGGGAGGGAGVDAKYEKKLDEALYRQLIPSIMGPISRIAAADDADGPTGAFASGTKMGRSVWRSMLDGQCFARRMAESERLHVVVLMDRSGSMDTNYAGQAFAVAQAFGECVAKIAESVTLLAFDSVCEEVRDFRTCPPRGGTGMANALSFSRAKLAGCNGRKVIVAITDGQADRPVDADRECRKCKDDHINVIGIAYRVNPNEIRKSMSSANIIAANGPDELAIQMIRIASEIAR